ncbi:uncharacterized protein THITE_157849 [Thermothielavioides terrestris NRRL 8126]|uniref:NmrA-like domain-containing protein n=1 Tax=Thermothielavioides terrestris (strain ATCC 38088 / NRRL 8126) TaxID=578455 RepID=G2QWG1_THETT|nr:uncharacterized protein THITE_157849 [Thermothielavioides terrestris NRRL 8126]AEO63936.1 hypothetical protein THITE_157849 [Thermothielavioides terrestris NRRL 8126]
MPSSTVIVFGPSGHVASVAAQTAASLGAQVHLALRDPSKAIPLLDSSSHKFPRVQADLTQPETVQAAARATGATAAFIYRVFGGGANDHMRGTLRALRDGGVRFVVFLSSGTVTPRDAAALSGAYGPDRLIPFEHAETEAALAEVFGPGAYAAVRPGFFATNLLNYKKMVAEAGTSGGVIKAPYPAAEFDFIAPEDMGRVCGRLLVDGPELLGAGKEAVFLAGPQVVPQGQVIELLGEVLGKELKAENYASDDEAVQSIMADHALPESTARQLVASYRATAEGKPVFDPSTYAEGVANVEKYSGRPAMTIREWLEANKDKFVQA